MEINELKKTVLENIDLESSEKFLKLINNMLDNPEDKDIKASFANFYNEVYAKIYVKFPYETDDNLRNFLRYSFVEDFLSGDNITKISNFDTDVIHSVMDVDYPILYADEWLELVNSDEIPSTAGDDLTKMTKKQTPAEKLKEFLQRHGNEKKNLDKMVILRQSYITQIHSEWKKILMTIITKEELESVEFEKKLKNDRNVSSILDYLPKLNAINSRITGLINQMKMASKTIDNLKDNVSDEDMQKIRESENEVLVEELKSVRQLYKMCIGRQGNETPYLCDHSFPNEILDRKKAALHIEAVRKIDPTIFQRTFLKIDSDNPPYTLLCPVYGKNGVCWESIPKINKETGRGKIALPLYPEIESDVVVIKALGDYRWQKEKEIAGFRWMNEGLTGQYYMYHEGLKSDKRKGKKVIPFNNDLKESFIENYILWIKYESHGMQKLDKEVRKIFWFSIPFSTEIQDTLKDRGFHFKQLWENTQRKSMSDGY
ncbi:MAG: hypothetical protein M0R46_07410 [Candidatus Muirbacterium halophilum]|nr:hypothetical protein [Candidatus Muirbacterium halophilum]MCK9475727.1 hypothetical protein [Candidatus Muirbacterium halophilum]